MILVSWLTVKPWLGWRTTHYVFTTHRVLIRRGILHHIGRDISLQRISDVGFRQSLWDRIVRAGTLTITRRYCASWRSLWFWTSCRPKPRPSW